MIQSPLKSLSNLYKMATGNSSSAYSLRKRHGSQITPGNPDKPDKLTVDPKQPSIKESLTQNSTESDSSQQNQNPAVPNQDNSNFDPDPADSPTPPQTQQQTTTAKGTVSPSSEGTKPKKQEPVEIPVINMVDFTTVDMDDKLNLLMAAINKINTTFYHKFEDLSTVLTDEDGIVPRITDIETKQEEHESRLDGLEEKQTLSKNDFTSLKQDLTTRIIALENDNERLKNDVFHLKGIVQVQDKQLTTAHDKIVDLTARNMSNNIVIDGLAGDATNENCAENVLIFLRTKLLMTVEAEEIIVAHRIGTKTGTRTRPMVVRCQHKLRERVFQYMKNLKGVTNENDLPYSVKSQLPEPLHSQRRDREDKMRAIKKSNNSIPEEHKEKRLTVQIKNKTLFVNNVAQKQHIFPPTVQDLFNVDKHTQKKLNDLQIEHTDPVEDKHSIFMDHAAAVKNTTEVRLAYLKMKQLYPEMDHIMMGYHVKSYTGFHDHGEHAAGPKILKILTERNLPNTVVFVTRNFGGIHIGPRRYIHIERVTRDALNLLNPF